MSRSTQVNLNGDHISNLHPSVLNHILSRLPIKDVVRTSIWSKDWKFKWASDKQSLDIYTFVCKQNISLSSFANIADTVLLNSPDITSFCLRRQGKHDSLVALPSSLLNRTSLRILKLDFPCTFNVADKVCLPNLKSLYFGGVQFVNENCNNDTLSLTFPVLETFELVACKWVNVKFVEVYAPALTTFLCDTDLDEFKEVKGCSINILGARLSRLDCGGDLPQNVIMDGLQVVYASLCNYYELPDEGEDEYKLWLLMLASLLGGPAFHLFDKLRRLTLELTCNLEQLFELLHATPSLEFLKVDVTGFRYDCDFYTGGYVPSCIITHLEEVEFENSYAWEPELPEHHLAKFLLKNAKELKKISLRGHFSIDERDTIEEELSTLRRFQTYLTIEFPDI